MLTPGNDFGLTSLQVLSAVKGPLAPGAQAEATIVLDFVACPKITQGVRVCASSSDGKETTVALVEESHLNSADNLLRTLEEFGAPVMDSQKQEFIRMVNECLTDVFVTVPENA